MEHSIIRHLATSYKGSKCAAGTFERLVSVWDLNNGQKISQFDTCLDFGGSRLAISEDGEFVATGAYRRYGVEMYITDGTILWKRPDLKKVQYIKFEPWEENLLACMEESPCYLLDAKTGRTIRTYERMIYEVSASPHHKDIVALASKKKKKKVCINELSTGNEIFFIEENGKRGILSMAFTPNSFCISEVGGPLSCFDLEDGSLMWRYDPSREYHFLRLGYSEGMKAIFGVLWAFETGGNKEIYWFDTSTGEVCGKRTIEGLAVETEFALRGNSLITSDGDVYDLCNKQGPVIRMHLDFPKEG